jgi:hypothetical protein
MQPFYLRNAARVLFSETPPSQSQSTSEQEKSVTAETELTL